MRADAPETLAYFRQQGVEIKVISGDNPATVATIAAQGGSRRARSAPSTRATFPRARSWPRLMETTTVFGRVHSRPEARHGGGPAEPRPHRGHDRRRGQRRPCPQEGRHGHRHGHRHRRRPGRVAVGARRFAVLHPARRRGGRPAGDRQHRTGGQPLHQQERLGRRPGAGRRDGGRDPTPSCPGT